MPCEARLKRTFCEANILFVLILGSHDSGLVYHAFVCKASAVEGAGAFSAVAWFVSVVGVGVAVYDFVVMSLYNGLHIFSTTVSDFESVAIKILERGLFLWKCLSIRSMNFIPRLGIVTILIIYLL